MSTPDCPTCGGRGWVADGTAHGAACLDCADPAVQRFVATDGSRYVVRSPVLTYRKKPARGAPQNNGVHRRGNRRR